MMENRYRIRPLARRKITSFYFNVAKKYRHTYSKQMAMVMDCEESIANLYATYRKFVQGKKGIVYAIDRDHARHITEYYQRQKVNCCWIEAKTLAAERDRLVQQYRDGLIDVVVNMDILSEGADFPEVEFIQLARSYRMGCMASHRTAEYSIKRCSNTSEGQTTAILPIAPIRIWSIRTGRLS